MTAREVVYINGDGGSDSPLMCAVRRLHAWLDGQGVAYCVVGDLAVVRAGWVRTTDNVDVLVDRDGWAPLVAVKMAVYLSKLAEYGEELAAKDRTTWWGCCGRTRVEWRRS